MKMSEDIFKLIQTFRFVFIFCECSDLCKSRFVETRVTEKDSFIYTKCRVFSPMQEEDLKAFLHV